MITAPLKAMTATCPQHNTLLIVGYGNQLRGDDGVGPEVARTVSDWQIPAVKALAVQQLLPELAVEIAAAGDVIFVDARHTSGASALDLEPIVVPPSALAAGITSALNHVCTPVALIALTQQLYGVHPSAWQLQIPTEHFELGRAFSKTAEHGVDSALRTIEQFLILYLQSTATPSEPCTKSA